VSGRAIDGDEPELPDGPDAPGDEEAAAGARADEQAAADDLDGDAALSADAAIPQDMPILLAETADLADPVEVAAGADGTSYRLGGRTFAWARGRAFEVQLGPEVASAALRTPDVTPSGRGTGWIRLAPAIIDDHAADRVVAWFELARRIAAGRQGGGGSGSHRH
jgi:hypothetical protein